MDLRKPALFALVAMAALAAAMQQGGEGTATLRAEPTKYDFEGNKAAGFMYMPNAAVTSADKPASVRREPEYRGKVRYGTIRVGNGPKADHVFAIDETEGEDARIYIDLNADGDLTNDGTGNWPEKRVSDGLAHYSGTFVFRASYGTPTVEKTASHHGLNVYWATGRSSINYYRAGARTGKVTVDGESYTVLLLDEGGDAVYNRPLEVDGKPTKPVFLFLDGQRMDARKPFALRGKNLEAVISADGSRLTLRPTTQLVAQVAPRPPTTPAPKLPENGTVAPDFEAIAWGGSPVKLSDLRGKVVVLDLWATWCGPCKASMPHVQKVHEKTKDQGVYVLALCVFDDKPAYEAWVPANKQYTFNFAFDPAARGDGSIARSKYNVTGIPTTFVIDRDGKIAASIVGYRGASDTRLEDALKQLGVDVGTTGN